MATLTAERTMLYCPKCQRKYEEGSQRFCNNDGGRLLPVVNSGAKREAQTKGVFTNLLGKTSKPNNTDEQLASSPRFVKSENKEPKIDKTSKNSVFKMERELKPKISKPTSKSKSKQTSTPKSQIITKPKLSVKSQTKPKPKPQTTKKAEVRKSSTSKPLSRLIDPNELKVNQAKVEKEKLKSNNHGLNWQNPRILIGQTVKGRYHVIDKINQDLTSVAFLAEDKILQNNKVCVRVLMNKNEKEGFQNKLLSEERVSLSHINHPNVANVFDSGELQDGKPFIISEYVENESVSEYLKKTGVFNPMRTARITRQASYALSEVHQNGILHRNLQPQHLLLTVSDAGNETVKVADFCVSNGKLTTDNIKYKSPEQLNGQLPTYASDSYSLAVIAFEMLTNRLPFSGETEGEIHKAQKADLTLEASNLNPDINVLVDSIFDKALSYNPSDRYPKSRDFGEALFNALTTAPPWENEEKADVEIDLPMSEEKMALPSFPAGISNEPKPINTSDISVEPNDITSDIHFDSNDSDMHFDSSNPEVEIKEINDVDVVKEEVEFEAEEKKLEPSTKDSLWQNRSPEPVREGGLSWMVISLLGLLILFAGVFGIWQYFNSLEPTPTEILQAEKDLVSKNLPAQGVDTPTENEPKVTEDNETPPVPRKVKTPKGFKYFENSKLNLNANLAKNFRGFTIAYPEGWKVKKFDKNKDKVDDKFLDIANDSEGGIPIEAMIISPYDSNGTFTKDEKLFPKLVEKSNADISKSLSGNFEVVSEGNTTIQNGRWKAYQVNFRTKESGEVNGKKIELWGRRLWIPVQRPGVKNGFIITMFASSLAEQIDSADDVGKKGELAEILQTFEPDQSY